MQFKFINTLEYITKFNMQISFSSWMCDFSLVFSLNLSFALSIFLVLSASHMIEQTEEIPLKKVFYFACTC